MDLVLKPDDEAVLRTARYTALTGRAHDVDLPDPILDALSELYWLERAKIISRRDTFGVQPRHALRAKPANPAADGAAPDLFKVPLPDINPS